MRVRRSLTIPTSQLFTITVFAHLPNTLSYSPHSRTTNVYGVYCVLPTLFNYEKRINISWKISELAILFLFSFVSYYTATVPTLKDTRSNLYLDTTLLICNAAIDSTLTYKLRLVFAAKEPSRLLA